MNSRDRSRFRIAGKQSSEGTGDPAVDRILEDRRKLEEMNKKRKEVKEAQEAKRLTNADKKRQRREGESKERRLSRLADKRNRSEDARAKETTGQRAKRLADKRNHSEVTRDKETPGQRAKRLADKRNHSEVTRAKETPGQRAKRLADKRNRSEDARAKETPEQRAKTLADKRNHSEDARAKETSKQRTKRLADMRNRSEDAKAQETSNQRANRLADMRNRSEDTRATETPAEAAGRHEADRTRKWHDRRRLQFPECSPAAKRQCDDESNPIKEREEELPIDVLLDELAKDDKFKDDVGFHSHATMWRKGFEECMTCNESFPGLNVNKSGVCRRCKNLRKNKDKFTAGNNMDPGKQPDELKGLTPAEEILISPVVPMMQVYHRPLGQLAYSGNVINLPQDVHYIATHLPRLPKDCQIVVIRKKGGKNTFKDFRVRRYKIAAALQYLKEHNHLFEDLEVVEERLQSLPEDDIMEFGHVIHEDDLPNEPTITEEEPQNDTPATDNANTDDVPCERVDDGSVVSSFVPVAREIRRELTLKEAEVDHVLDRSTDENRNTGIVEVDGEFEDAVTSQPWNMLPWPTVENAPIDEFSNVDYVCLAFPALFPTGVCKAHNASRFITDVSQSDYYQHLMRYKDGRFAKHSRFRYFALNTILRHRMMASGRVFVKKNPDEAKLTLDNLLKMAKSDKEALLKKINRFREPLSGSKEYWAARRQELLQMIKFKKRLPTIFFTLSAADTLWPDLRRLIGKDYSSGSAAVIENPLLCVWFFCERVKNMLDGVQSILRVKYKMEDYWGRLEFQHRGSIHFHGVAWLAGAPDVNEILKTAGEAQQKIIAQTRVFFDELLTSMHPGLDDIGKELPNIPLIPVNPTTIPYFRVEDEDFDYLGLLVYCQTHKCRVGYCRKTAKTPCRFSFPRTLNVESRIDVVKDAKTGTKKVEYVPKRNNDCVNSDMKELLRIHRANTDVQSILFKRFVVGYLTKYLNKFEPLSDALKFLAEHELSKTTSLDPMRVVVQRVLMHAVGDRDYSAQEVMHMLMSYKLYRCSRTFQTLFLHNNNELERSEGEPNIRFSTVEKYCARGNGPWADMSMANFYAKYRTEGGSSRCPAVKVKVRQQEAIVVPRGLRKFPKDSQQYEDYARSYLMVYKAYTEPDQLLGQHETYEAALEEFLQTPSGRNVEENEFDLTDDLRRTEQEVDGHNQELSNETEGAEIYERARRRGVPVNFADLLTTHPMFRRGVEDSCNHDWTAAYEENPQAYEQAKEFQKQARTNASDVVTEDVDPMRLIGKQREVFELVCQSQDNPILDSEPLRLIVTGTAGTGKSYLINCLKKLLGPKLLLIVPTGVAAFNARGKTAHSALHLPVHGSFSDLKGAALEQLQENLKDVQFLIIEEMSMIGQIRLARIDKRLRQAFPNRAQDYFGGRSVILVGDFGQLPPVGDTVMYGRRVQARKPEQAAGAMAYKSFRRCVKLDVVVRQQDDQNFRDLLQRVRSGTVKPQEVAILKTRERKTTQRYPDFEDATFLFSKVEATNAHNATRLGQLKKPIAMVNATHIGWSEAANAPSDIAGGLDCQLLLAESARIMLTANLNIDAGLCNGTVGTVRKIIYRSGEGPPAMPLVVVCEFPQYTGSTCFIDENTHLFPIIPITRNFSFKGVDTSRTMIPLKLAWALTVHKAQGLTLDKVNLDLGDRKFSCGLTLIGLSRVRRLTDILIANVTSRRLAKLYGKPQSSRWKQKEKTPIEMLREEDRRLERIERCANIISESDISFASSSTGSQPLSVTTSPLKSFHPMPMVSGGRSDGLQQVRLPSEPSVTPQRIPFQPLIAEQRRILADRCIGDRDMTVRPIPYPAPKMMLDNTRPKLIFNSKGDGHCFYHCISYGVAGNENFDGHFRDGLVEYFIVHRTFFEEEIGRQLLDDTIIDITDRRWATEPCLKGMAGFLETTIYLYKNDGPDTPYRWEKYAAPDLPAGTDTAIYLFHCDVGGRKSRQPNHFAVVVDVESE